jgi:hypothetical protein
MVCTFKFGGVSTRLDKDVQLGGNRRFENRLPNIAHTVGLIKRVLCMVEIFRVIFSLLSTIQSSQLANNAELSV